REHDREPTRTDPVEPAGQLLRDGCRPIQERPAVAVAVHIGQPMTVDDALAEGDRVAVVEIDGARNSQKKSMQSREPETSNTNAQKGDEPIAHAPLFEARSKLFRKASERVHDWFCALDSVGSDQGHEHARYTGLPADAAVRRSLAYEQGLAHLVADRDCDPPAFGELLDERVRNRGGA